MVSDFDACLRFYRDILGFPVTLDAGDGIYAEFDTGGVTLSLFRRDLMRAVVGTESKPINIGWDDEIALILAVENVDATCRDLQAKGITLTVPPTDRPVWALRTAHFRDPDGNLIEINHPIPMSEG